MKQINLDKLQMGDMISFNLWVGIASDHSTVTDVEYMGRVSGVIAPLNGLINKHDVHNSIKNNITSLPGLADIGLVDDYDYIIVKDGTLIKYYGVPWINEQTLYNLGVETMTITLPNNRLSEETIRNMFLIHDVSDLTVDITV